MPFRRSFLAICIGAGVKAFWRFKFVYAYEYVFRVSVSFATFCRFLLLSVVMSGCSCPSDVPIFRLLLSFFLTSSFLVLRRRWHGLLCVSRVVYFKFCNLLLVFCHYVRVFVPFQRPFFFFLSFFLSFFIILHFFLSFFSCRAEALALCFVFLRNLSFCRFSSFSISSFILSFSRTRCSRPLMPFWFFTR